MKSDSAARKDRGEKVIPAVIDAALVVLDKIKKPDDEDIGEPNE